MSARRARGQRVLPIGYLTVALAAAALILPSVLRPPQDQQNTSASFSPDAPPDESPPEALIQSIRRAQSSTAGRKQTQSLEEETVVIQQEVPPKERKATRAGCFGDPPRQTESLYSALCVPAWTGGDNGGATMKGVTKDEIVVAFPVNNSSRVPEGKVPREFDATDHEDMHHYKVWQTYFNDRYEFYGRYLQLCLFKANNNTVEGQQQGIQNAESVCNPFAIVNGSDDSAATQETLRRKIIEFGSINNPAPWYAEHHPYAYSFYMDSYQTRYLASEMICKQWNTRPLGENNINKRSDPLFDYDAPRVYGIVAYQDTTRTGAVDMYKDLLARCGIEIKAEQTWNLEDNAQSIAGAAQKMKAAGVTSIVTAADGFTMSAFSREAQRLQYWPEYLGAGSNLLDSNGSIDLWDDGQAPHLVTISPNEIPRPEADRDWYRAYKEVDPSGDPGMASAFRALQQISNGIQHAGGIGADNWILTPERFWEGLKAMPYRVPDPKWSIGGGYRDNDYTYMDYVSLAWFNQDGPNDPEFCHLFGGQRYKLGELPEEDLPWQRTDAGCIYRAEAGVQG